VGIRSLLFTFAIVGLHVHRSHKVLLICYTTLSTAVVYRIYEQSMQQWPALTQDKTLISQP